MNPELNNVQGPRATRIVFDSTVFVSAFLSPQGVCKLLFRWCLAYARLYATEELLAEVENTLLERRHLRRRYDYDDNQVQTFLKVLRARCIRVSHSDIGDVELRDPNDIIILECAQSANADYLITRDKDLLAVGRHNQTLILKPEQFVRLLRDRQRSTQP